MARPAIFLEDIRDQLGTEAVRILNAFRDVQTIDQIAALGRQQARRRKKIGLKSMNILDLVLAEHGIAWAPIVRCYTCRGLDVHCESCDGSGWRRSSFSKPVTASTRKSRAELLISDAKARCRLRTQIMAPEDPEVLALCERLGFGAVMDSAMRQWIRRDPVGAFYIGGCIGSPPKGSS